MIVYRLCKSEWKHDLSGKGAEIAGGRWNSKGIAIVYASSSRALCMAEIAVHTPLGCLPVDYFMVEIGIPSDTFIIEVFNNELPHNWQSFANRNNTQFIGDNFIKENKFLVLKVPSAVVPGDFNYLINPAHREKDNISILKKEVFRFDQRLFGFKNM
jgi:RES domain-containing protein